MEVKKKQRSKKHRRFGWVMVGIGLGCLLSHRAIATYGEQSKKQREFANKVSTEENRRRELIERKVRAESPIGKEVAAREQGYLKKNERPLESVR